LKDGLETMFKWRVAWLAALGLCLLVAGWLWYSGRETLVWYTSPPLRNSNLRFRLLVPSNWPGGLWIRQDPSGTVVHLGPRRRKSLPWWIRQFGIGEQETDGIDLWVSTSVTSAGTFGPVKVTDRHPADPAGDVIILQPTASRALEDAGGHTQGYAVYYRDNKTAFDRTHRTILDSVHIVMPP
jgi:hypothetical protein